MSKKIKALVQKYEKDMQFENRFDDLKHKLDLIPDAEVKSEVFTIKRKVMPAYVMMVVLLMLVTGIIGLQFGLNSDFVEGPTTVDNVEFKLMELVDSYERESVSTVLLDEFARVHFYVGIKNNEPVIIAFLKITQPDIIVELSINNETFTLTNLNQFIVINLVNFDISITYDVKYNDNVIHSENSNFDFEPYYSDLME